MKRIILSVAAFVVAVGVCAACVPIKPPPPGPGPSAAPAVAIGDSVAYLIGSGLDVENDAVGGTTCRDTQANLPNASKVMLSSGGHSWALYDEAAWQSCILAIVSHYGATNVWVATPDVPASIYCADPNVATQQLDAAGIAHGDLFANPDFELRQRLDNARAWELNVLRSQRPGVHVVDMSGVSHYGPPDCVHLDGAGIADADARLRSAGF